MRVLIGCEFSGVVREAFRLLGHEAWSCDEIPAEDGSEFHLQCDVLSVLDRGWDLGIFHPPCTYLANSGVRHLHDHCMPRNGKRAKVFGAARFAEMREAAGFFLALKAAPIPRIAIENPTPHKYAVCLIGRYQQAIQPWEFGHGETKRTCLWLKNLPPLMATALMSGRHPRIHLMPPGKERSKERSRTYAGIAKAMAEQWGCL